MFGFEKGLKASNTRNGLFLCKLGTSAFWHLYFSQFQRCISLCVSKVFLLQNTLSSSTCELRLGTGVCWGGGGGGGGGRATGGKVERPVTWLLKQLVAANHCVFVSICHLYFFQFLNRIFLALSYMHFSFCILSISLFGGRARGQSPGSSN